MRILRTMPAGRQVLMTMILSAAMLVAGGCSTFDWSTGKWVGAGKPSLGLAEPAAPPVAPIVAPAVVSPAASPAPSPAPVVSPAAATDIAPAASPAPAEVAPASGGIAAEKAAVFRAMDTLAYPRQPVELVAHLRSAAGLKPIAGATVAFTRGDWVAGRITTDANGMALMRWTPPEAGNYSFEAGIVAVPDENSRDMLGVKATLLVAARDKKSPQVVVDLDHAVADGGLFAALAGGGKPLAGSVEVLGRISKRYGIVYLTARPDLPSSKSKSWLADAGYPSGPVLVSRMKDVTGGGRFNSGPPAALRRYFPGLAVGIVEKLSDAQAYVDNGMSAYLMPDYRQTPGDMRTLAAELRALRGQGRLQVVENWRQIEQGILAGKQFGPEDFARDLEARAARIEGQRTGL